MDDHYAILGVEPDAKVETIRAAHRARARRCHPDHGGDVAEMMHVNEAWRVLRDPASRAAYDAVLIYPAIAARARKQDEGRVVLDFGRYKGRSLQEIAATDDDYLAWLERTPAGIPLRADIRRVLDERRRALDALRPTPSTRRTWAFR